jgi:hypothetical protein
MIAGRWPRLFVALGLFAMHFNIYLLTTHILYWESMVLLLSFGLAADEPDWQTAQAPVAPTGSRDGVFAAIAVLLTLCALAGVVHQARRYARSHDASGKAAVSGEPSTASAPGRSSPEQRGADRSAGPPSSPTVSALRQVGPFAVGNALGDGWSIQSMNLSDGGLMLAMSGAPGRARFEVTCAPSPHRSPFDLGAAHIFYSKDLEFHQLEAVGRRLQEKVRAAAEGRDVCEALAAWRTAAQTPSLR